MKKTIALLGEVLGLAGCDRDVSYQQINAAVTARAAYDFDCKENGIKVTQLQESRYDIPDMFNTGTYGAAGCEKKATHTVVNEHGRGKLMVYKEGAVPNPVVVNGINPIKPAAIPTYTPSKPYRSSY